MKIEELKSKIESNSLKNVSMIWVIKEESSKIITDQYRELISSNLKLTQKFTDNFSEIPVSGFIEDTNLYILETDEFEGENTENNCIVICNKATSSEAIQFPKLEEWQFIDYCLSLVPGLNKNDLSWLSSKMNQNFFQLRNEVLKIAVFDKDSQRRMFEYLVKEGDYDRYSNITIFDLTNAIFKKDIKTVREVLKVIDYVDITGMLLLSILYKNFKTILSIQMNPKITANDLGIKDNQFWAIKKNNVGYYSNEQLVKIFGILTNAEYMFKFGGIDADKQLLNYLIVKILEA